MVVGCFIFWVCFIVGDGLVFGCGIVVFVEFSVVVIVMFCDDGLVIGI